MLATLDHGEFLRTPEQICSRDLLAAGDKQLRNVADVTTPPATKLPLTFCAHPSGGENP